MSDIDKIDESKFLVFPNGMLAVFDENGQQIPQYQGKLKDILEEWENSRDEILNLQEILFYLNCVLFWEGREDCWILEKNNGTNT